MAWQIQCTASPPLPSLPSFTPKSLPSPSLFYPLPSTLTRSPRFRSTHVPSPKPITASLSAVESSTSRDGPDDSNTSTPLLEVKGLTAVIAETKQQILKGVDLVINPGEVNIIFVSFQLTIFLMLDPEFNN